MEKEYQFQTLSEFIREPFGRSDDRGKIAKYMSSYRRDKNKIKLNAHTRIEGAYYFHVKIPSESKKEHNVFYDVVIKFFTNNKDAEKSSHIRNYYIQFFSNSPGFIYNYAVLYKNHGFLIENLYRKMDPLYFDKLPEKTNPNLDLSYDKSIYYACMFLSEHRFRVLNKVGIALGKNLSPKFFFNEIKDFQTIKIEQELINLEKNSLKSVNRTLDIQEKLKKNDKKRELDIHRKKATTSTATQKRKIVINKVMSSKSTSSKPSITRKSGRKTTRRP